VVLAAACAAACAPRQPDAGLTYVDPHTLRGPRNFITGIDLANADGSFNTVVEIPAGTNEKWEVCTFAALSYPDRFPGCTAPGRELIHEVRNGQRRVIRHLGYPGNYGALPQTRSGDDDPLDVIVIGPAAERGAVLPVTVVGVLRCRDGSEPDDKLVAIAPGSPLHGRVSTAQQLIDEAPRAADMLLDWFMGYKGDDSMTCDPLADETVAATIIGRAHERFKRGS
jgi:inorganic pyrophosphatase